MAPHPDTGKECKNPSAERDLDNMQASMSNQDNAASVPPIPERRAHPRQDAASSLAYVDVGADNGGLLLNISEGGICVQTAMKLVGVSFPVVRLQLQAGGGWIEAAGRLAWIGDSNKVAGIAFTEISEAARSQIRNWLASQSSVREQPEENENSATEIAVSPNSFEERRVRSRQNVAEALAYVDFGQDNGGIVLDVSEGGIAVQTALPLRGESFPLIRFQMRGGGSYVEVSGRLAWINESRKVAGIAFTDVSEDARSRINDWINLESSPDAARGPRRKSGSVVEFRLPTLDSITQSSSNFSEEPDPQFGSPVEDPEPDTAYGHPSEDFGSIPTFHIPSPDVLASWRKRSQMTAAHLRRLGARFSGKKSLATRIAIVSAIAFALGLAIGHVGSGKSSGSVQESTTPRNEQASSQPSPIDNVTASDISDSAINSTLSGEDNNLPNPAVSASAQASGISLPPISKSGDVAPRNSSTGISSGSPPGVRTSMPPVESARLKPHRDMSRRQVIRSPSHPSKILSAKNTKLLAPPENPTRTSEFPTRPSKPSSVPASEPLREKPPSSAPQLPSPVLHAEAHPPASAPPVSNVVPAEKPKSPESAEATPHESVPKHPKELNPEPFRTADHLDACQLIHSAEPVYPREAEKRHVEGTVTLRIVVGTDGNVQSVKPVSGPPQLVSAAEDAAREFRYIPAFLNGKPIEAIQTVNILFRLRH